MMMIFNRSTRGRGQTSFKHTWILAILNNPFPLQTPKPKKTFPPQFLHKDHRCQADQLHKICLSVLLFVEAFLSSFTTPETSTIVQNRLGHTAVSAIKSGWLLLRCCSVGERRWLAPGMIWSCMNEFITVHSVMSNSVVDITSRTVALSEVLKRKTRTLKQKKW